MGTARVKIFRRGDNPGTPGTSGNPWSGYGVWRDWTHSFCAMETGSSK